MVAIFIDTNNEVVTTRLYLSRDEAESFLCEKICQHYEPDAEDEDSDWNGVDISDLTELLEKDNEKDEYFQLSCVKEFDLHQHLPVLAPSVNMALPDAKHMP